MPSVSVIIPTYNRAGDLKEAMHSVLNQTFVDFELIVVDDGSTDNTRDVAESFTDPRVRYIFQVNQGASSARNVGIQVSQGEFIAFLDSDDLFLPEKLSLQVARMEEDPDAGLVYGKYLSQAEIEELTVPIGDCSRTVDLRRLLLGPAFHMSTVLVRRNLLVQIGGFDASSLRGEDWELALKLALSGCKMVCVPEILSVIRRHPVSNMREQYQHEEGVRSILDKLFADPRMPEDVLELKNRAYAGQQIRTACSAYLSSQYRLGKVMLERALEMDPTLVDENINHLTSALINMVKGLSIEDPQKTLKQITEYLPGDKRFAKKLKRRLWGRFFLVMSFQAYKQDRLDRCRYYSLRAAVYTPAYLQNRGFLSLMVRAFLGTSLIGSLKNPSSKKQIITPNNP